MANSFLFIPMDGVPIRSKLFAEENFMNRLFAYSSLVFLCYLTGCASNSLKTSVNGEVASVWACPSGYVWSGLSLDCFSSNSAHDANELCYMPGSKTLRCAIGPAEIANVSSIAAPVRVGR